MIVMFDTVTTQDIPSTANTSAEAVAGYVDGRFRTEDELLRQDPKAHHLSIAVSARDLADCLDIESGDATIAQAPSWWHLATMHGIWRPCFYIQLSNARELVDTLTRAGIHRSSYRLWSAHWTGVPHVEAGSDATQWTDRALGRNLDESLCLQTFFPVRRGDTAHPLHRLDVAELEFEPDTGQWKITPRPARHVQAI